MTGQGSDENSPQEKVSSSLIVESKKLPQKNKYQCTFCHERFRNKDSLDRHVYHHTNEV